MWHALFGSRRIVTRLVVAVAVAMAAVLLLAAGFVYWRVSYALDRQLDQDLGAWRSVVVRAVGAGTQPPANTPGLSFQVYDGQGRQLSGGSGVERLVGLDRVREVMAGQKQKYDVGRFLPAPRHSYRVDVERVRTSRGDRVVAAVISRSKHDEALRELLLQLAIADLLALVAASFVGYRTARAALDPVESYRRAAERAKAGELSRLPVAEDRDDELSRLGHTLNDLLARIDAGATRERQFLADAAHELRTPLALMTTELEWARHRPRTGEEIDGVIVSLQQQVRRLVSLANALLDLEELRAAGPLPRDRVALREVVADAVRDGVPRDRHVTTEVPDVLVEVDRRWLSIALANLLGNAVRHGGERVTLVASYAAPRLRVVVRDDGPGFPEDFRPVAFDRFSRADRSRSTPGSGLGLFLVRSVASAHGGSVRLLDGPGAAVEMELDAPG